MNRSQKAKILIFEPHASQESVDALNKRYAKNMNISVRYVDPSELQGGYVPPKALELVTTVDTPHATKVGISAISGYRQAAGDDAKDIALELVIVRVNQYDIKEEYKLGIDSSSEHIERYNNMIDRFLPRGSRDGVKVPYTKEQRDNNPGLQQIKKVMDAESKLGEVLGANFSYTIRGAFNTTKGAEGKAVSREEALANSYQDHLNVLFTENRGPWGPTLVALAKDNYGIEDYKLAKDSPGILEDAVSTTNRLDNYSSVINIDNEAVRTKDAGTLSHLNIDYFQDKRFKGNSFTSPYILTNMLVNFMKIAQETFPFKTNPKATKLLQKSASQSLIRAARENTTNIRGVSSIFKETAKATLNTSKLAKLANVTRALTASLEAEDRINPRNKVVEDPLSIFKGLGPPTEGANFDISNL